MTLEDFEKELKAQKEADNEHHHSRHKDKKDSNRTEHWHRHRHNHHDDGHRHKRRRRSSDDSGERDIKHERSHNREQAKKHDNKKPLETKQPSTPVANSLKRDSWMNAPSALQIDYTTRPMRAASPPKADSLNANFERKRYGNELKRRLQDMHTETPNTSALEQPAQHTIDYTIGDNGSQWRMTKLKQIYRRAEESGRSIEDIAVEKYGDLRDFDDAREEEIELERREMYGSGYVGKDKPSGELFQERKMSAGVRSSRPQPLHRDDGPPKQGSLMSTKPASMTTEPLTQSSLNKLKATLLKAQLRGDPQAARLEEEYNQAVDSVAHQQPKVVLLSAMDNRMLSTAPRNEVKAVENQRGLGRGTVVENDDMSIEDMVREERRTRGQTGGEGQRLAERIARDGQFDNGLDYMDENAAKLARRVQSSGINLRNTAINDFRKMNRVLDNCPLCFHEDTDTPPIAPVVSLATRTYLTLPTEPEIITNTNKQQPFIGGACIVPIQHRTNLLECDDDEWEEIRNFMKCLARFYFQHQTQPRSVIFYENAAEPQRKRHAALHAIPLSPDVAETAPAFFKEALLAAEGEWSQHKKIIDTLGRSRHGSSSGNGNSNLRNLDGVGRGSMTGLGKHSFRRSLVKEMPYFHVWFELDGGMGHVVEDPQRWPRGDLFARQVIGGMVDADPDVVRKQGRWTKDEASPRVEAFKQKWQKWDWTTALVQEG